MVAHHLRLPPTSTTFFGIAIFEGGLPQTNFLIGAAPSTTRPRLLRFGYDTTRRHCGTQSRWDISITKLKDKAGSTSTDKEVKRMLTQIIKDTKVHDHIPDCEFSLSWDLLVVRPKKAVKVFTGAGQSLTLQPNTYEEARHRTSGWNVKSLESEWKE